MNSRERRLLMKAVIVSLASSCAKRHGVVVAAGNRVLAVAVNTDRNKPEICSDPKTEAAYHAEINALKQLRGVDLSGATLYSARTNRAGKGMLARPCERCAKAIEKTGLKKIIYTTGEE